MEKKKMNEERCPFCKRPLHGLSALLQPYHNMSDEELRKIAEKDTAFRILNKIKKYFPIKVGRK